MASTTQSEDTVPEDGPPEDAVPGDWQAHVIVCGLTEVALRVIEQLRHAGERVVVVDDAPDQRLLRICQELGAVHLAESGRRAGTLRLAGIAGAAALVCAADSDLDNLEVALLGRRLRDDLRVEVQLGNESVGHAVERVTGPGSVLDVATIAAPTLAESCLDLHSRILDIGGVEFVLQEVRAPRGGTLRELFGDLAPVAVVPADGGDMQVCPGRDLSVGPGDRVVVIGSADDLHRRGLYDAHAAAAARRPRRAPPLRRYVRGFVASSETQLRMTLRVLLAVAVCPW